MIKNWLKIAFTNYKKNWLTTLINLLGLSVGLTVFLLVFLNWQDEKSYEKWVPEGDNVYYVERVFDHKDFNAVCSYPFLEVPSKTFPEIQNFSVINYWEHDKVRLLADGRSSYSSPAEVSEDFFKVLPFPLVAGSYNNLFVDENSVALSEDVAKQLFGNSYKESIGKMVTKDENGKKVVVQAIYKLPAEEENTIFRPGYAVRSSNIDYNKNIWSNNSFFGFFRVKPGTNISELENKLSAIQTKQQNIELIKSGWPEMKNPIKIRLVNIKKMRLDAKSGGLVGSDKKSILILLSLSGLIMILSAINFINLNTAQASQRAKEVGVRKSFGSSKGQLVVQFLLETFIIYISAFFISMILLELLLPLYSKFLNKMINIGDPVVYLYAVLIVSVFAFISGIVPAVYLSGFKPIQTLKGNFSRSKHGIWLRNSILSLQIIISSFFIISSFIIYKQVDYMMQKDLGFNGEQVYQLNFNKTSWGNNYNMKKYQLYSEKIKHFPGVIDVTGSSQTLGNGVNSTTGVKYKKDSTKSLDVGVGAIDLNFTKFYKVKFLSGRDFNPKLTTDTTKAIVVNEAFVRKIGWNNQEAIGKEMTSNTDDKARNMVIVGVVKDMNFGDVQYKIEPIMFFNYDRFWTRNNLTSLQIKLSGEHINENLAGIRKYWETEVEPGYPFSGEFINKQFAKTFEKYKKQRFLFSILNAIVLLVALLGLFALSSLIIEQKLKDVAIKKTLGASDGILIKDLTKKFLWITTLAVILSIPLSYYFMSEWLKDFAYRIEMPWWPYVLSLAILLLLTILVVSIKAYRATKVELIKYLKYE
ncbi:ABC transporter permease [Elizabethkingia meningoseptica]|uniref:ABC transporter permease n=1 Tax=Elizabethkingia meningoseptica TaxID=238 RepID=UPI0023B08A88|nr:FtsX-like permease family protein [Elizabethkingia meningoseptica]MDE5438833.1 ABC transporter permease [Elizabethkingia meningoseptica]MDE5507968.1 ABC transporter permease [Elizabethkingia meningoseptica]MDE5516164.1 ABC transporter permease [Elizabethkingia meningoseptica]MDE5526429.1 ABC transporter permease [Elizabethkingia meningoseptica]MDE5530411.1 ABC transporter permease [Elizabethkingia meningoseptica]